MCVLRMSLESERWDSGYIDVQAGGTVTLRPVGSKTYFVFGSVVKRRKTLERFRIQMYKTNRDNMPRVYKDSSRTPRVELFKAFVSFIKFRISARRKSKRGE